MKQLRQQLDIMLEWTDDEHVDYSISGNRRIKKVRNNAHLKHTVVPENLELSGLQFTNNFHLLL
jgi:hypothetical protein